MKKLFALILTLVMVLSLSACGNSSGGSGTSSGNSGTASGGDSGSSDRKSVV